MNTVRILFDLRSGFGLGDLVQFQIVLKHLKRYRPHWVIDCAIHNNGCSSLLSPHCNRVWDGEKGTLESVWDNVIVLNWTDVFETFPDRPSTKVAFALKNVFGIERYDTDLGRYEMMEPETIKPAEHEFDWRDGVSCHFWGSSHHAAKNLGDNGMEICRYIEKIGHKFVGIGHPSLQLLATIIRSSKAFIGIDSGPGKVASATNTPTLICWTGHHPLRYHDPAPNTTHLIPQKWRWMPPFCETVHFDPGVAMRYFTDHYTFRTYNLGELAKEACAWLRETLK